MHSKQVQSAEVKTDSHLNLLKRVMKLREEPGFQWGAFHLVNRSQVGINSTWFFAFFRVAPEFESNFLILANGEPKGVLIENVTAFVESQKESVSKACERVGFSCELPVQSRFLVKFALNQTEYKETSVLTLRNQQILIGPDQVLVLQFLPDL